MNAQPAIQLLTWGRYYWPIFLIISAIWIITGFGIPEIMALVTRVSAHTDNTLSYYARTELNVSVQTTVHTIAWYLTFIVWTVFNVIITAHIWFGQFG